MHRIPVSFIVGQTDFMRNGGQSDVGIVLTEQNPIFGSAREHAVRLVDSFGHQVVGQYADIRLVPPQHERFVAAKLQRSVDSCHQSLSRGLFVSGRSVHLPGEIETVYLLGFQ